VQVDIQALVRYLMLVTISPSFMVLVPDFFLECDF